MRNYVVPIYSTVGEKFITESARAAKHVRSTKVWSIMKKTLLTLEEKQKKENKKKVSSSRSRNKHKFVCDCQHLIIDEGSQVVTFQIKANLTITIFPLIVTLQTKWANGELIFKCAI